MHHPNPDLHHRDDEAAPMGLPFRPEPAHARTEPRHPRRPGLA